MSSQPCEAGSHGHIDMYRLPDPVILYRHLVTHEFRDRMVAGLSARPSEHQFLTRPIVICGFPCLKGHQGMMRSNTTHSVTVDQARVAMEDTARSNLHAPGGGEMFDVPIRQK